MSKTNKNTTENQGLAVLNGKNTQMPAVLEMLDKALQSVDKITGSDYITGGNIEGFSKNVKDEQDIANLVKMAASVISRERAYNEAAENLELSTFPQFKIGGSTKDEWIKDIKLRIAIINNSDTINKIKEFKEKTAKFLSEEDQKAILFKDMENFLKGVNIK